MSGLAARARRDPLRRPCVAGTIVALALLAIAASAPAAPRPLPTPIGLVSDFANVIDPATRALLTARLEELRRKTTAEIAVVTVPTTAPDTAFDYAMRLAEAWKPGAAGKDNGVLFLVSVDDRALYILTGYGVEGALPDGLVGEIRDRTIVPRARSGDLAGGIRAGVERMAAILAREYGVELAGTPARAEGDKERRTAPGLLQLLPLIIITIIVMAALSSAFASDPRRRRRGGWGVGPMWGGGLGSGGFGGSGGGFGGFGGGGFGGGGAGGKW